MFDTGYEVSPVVNDFIKGYETESNMAAVMNCEWSF
jgi:hypothetical protein